MDNIILFVYGQVTRLVVTGGYNFKNSSIYYTWQFLQIINVDR